MARGSASIRVMKAPPKESPFESLVRQVRALPLGRDGVAAVLEVFEQFTGRRVYFSKARRLRANPPEHIRRTALRIVRGGDSLAMAEQQLADAYGISPREARRYAVEAARAIKPRPRRTDGPGASLG